VILTQNHKITIMIWNHDFKSNDFKSFPTLRIATAYNKLIAIKKLFYMKPFPVFDDYSTNLSGTVFCSLRKSQQHTIMSSNRFRIKFYRIM